MFAGSTNNFNLSFAGCGFLGIYHVGVASCFRQYAPHLIADKISGASAGSLVACAMICGCELGEATSFTLNLATKARARALGPLHPSFDIVRHLRTALNAFLPDNAHKIATGRLFVSLTRVHDRKNILVSQFDSKDDLIQALLCSAHVPFYSAIMPPKFKGVRYVDGGLSVNNPVLNDNTITVSPFAGESDICPDDNSASFLHMTLAGTSIQLNSGNLYRMSHAFFPPPPEILSDMCRQGFEDALNFLQKNNLISCTKHVSVESSVCTQSMLDMARYGNQNWAESDEQWEESEEQWEAEFDDGWGRGMCEHCDECQEQRESAVLKSLPPAVVTALQSACDSVNHGLLAPIYNMQAFKLASLVAAPLFLPLDVAVVLAHKFYEWVPYMPDDIQWVVKEFVALLHDLLQMIQSSRHHYSARFTCQLAITELCQTLTQSHIQPQHYDTNRRNLGMGFAVNFHSHNVPAVNLPDEAEKSHDHHRSPTCERQRCSHDFRYRSHESMTTRSDSSDSLNEQRDIKIFMEDYRRRSSTGSSTRLRRIAALASSKHRKSSTDVADIDNIEAHDPKRDSILAWHYKDENNPRAEIVTEIFPMNDSQASRTAVQGAESAAMQSPPMLRRTHSDIDHHLYPGHSSISQS